MPQDSQKPGVNVPKIDEASYVAGGRALARSMIAVLIKEFDIDDPLAGAARALTELEDTRIALRELHEKYGDGDWDPQLHLADVVHQIEKGLDEVLNNGEDVEEGVPT